MKATLLVICMALLFSACGGPESDAQKAVSAVLRDPGSAKFGKFTQAPNGLACLAVNSKNEFGGYTGNQQAMLLKKPGETNWQVLSVTDAIITHDDCVNMIKNAKPREK